MGRLAALAPVLLLAGCGSGISFLDPHGPVAATQRDLLFQVTGWMMIVVLPAIFLVPFVAWRFRRRRNATYRPNWRFSWPLEILVWGVPIILVCILASLVLGKARALDPYAPIPSDLPPLEVEVVGLDYKWLFIYPEQNIASVGVMAVPVDRPVHFRLTSDTVMQSFMIPALGSQIYAMAGMVTELNLMADRPGVLMGQNTQFNGFGFQDQKFDTLALPQAEFDRWIAAARTAGRSLDQGAYALVSQKGKLADLRSRFDFDPQKGLIFSTVDPDLFGTVVSRYRAHADHGNTASDHATGEHHHADH
ncbi:cytochrome ubiquinol oxidase subunit II [Falsirhodobacter halotolerans]|uniref:cytochrome ubiquinol oxidase subunit II n=1 Tax=Falsirhodobacter halotolerans TaxID=1146892 RepID=UPI001FD5848C|nr:cytochrome ubiquinol oxidase subunit II [Falsirhodobacter halotolerans]MCJ8138295.1 cytochrome ubiquinol oxidase subunit II [Falsirhodobacter halotolerans]